MWWESDSKNGCTFEKTERKMAIFQCCHLQVGFVLLLNDQKWDAAQRNALFCRLTIYSRLNCVNGDAANRVCHDALAINFNKLLMLSCFSIDSILSPQKAICEVGKRRPVGRSLCFFLVLNEESLWQWMDKCRRLPMNLQKIASLVVSKSQ